MSEITIGLMTLEDVEAVHAIEAATFKTPWSKESFYREVTDNPCARYVVLREDGVAVAYAGVWFVLDEGHITNIAVREDRRGIGYGERVTRAMIQLAADSGMNEDALIMALEKLPESHPEDDPMLVRED